MDTRGRKQWHNTRQRTDITHSPPERLVPSLTVPSGRGGGRSGGPQDNTDRNTGRGPPERNRQTGTMAELELWKPWRCRELSGHGGAGSSGGHGRAGSSGGHGGAGSSGGHGGAGSSWRPWRWSSGALASVPSAAAPTAGTPSNPPKKISLGKSGGIRSPPGLDTQKQYMTWQDSRARQTGQDIPQEPEALLGWLGSWGFLWAWRRVRGPHRAPSATAFHFHDKGAGG